MAQSDQRPAYGRRYIIFLLVFLGGLSAFGPFITDFYLPTLPAMADIFKTNASMVQLSLTAGMIGLAIGQIVFGPISDKYGRRPVLEVSLLIFIAASLGCIFAPSIEFFIACRVFQGLGGSGGIVMSRSIATDCYSGRELAKTLAIVGAINGVAPVAAPVIGGLVARFTSWQGIFAILMAIGIVLLLMCLPFRESLAYENRVRGGFGTLAKRFGALFKIKWFTLYVLMFGFMYGVLFSYISSASFIVQSHFGYSELTFALVFAVNAAASGIGSALCMKFKKMGNAALFCVVTVSFFALLQLIFTLLFDSFILYEGVTFMILFFLGFIFPSGTALCMTEGRQSIGAASAIVGASSFVFGGIVSPLVGLGDMRLTSSVVILLCSLIATAIAYFGAKRKDAKV